MKERVLIALAGVLVVVLIVFFGIAIASAAAERPSEIRAGGRLVATVPNGQEIDGFDYEVTPSNSWVTIRFKKKEKNNE